MTIRIQRDLYAGMPQPFLYDLGVYALLQHQRGVRMTCIVQPYIFNPGPLYQLSPGVRDAARLGEIPQRPL